MVSLIKKTKLIEFLGESGEESLCFQCNEGFDSEKKRRMRDECGHVKCLSCVIKVKEKCSQCFGRIEPVASSDPDSNSGPARDKILDEEREMMHADSKDDRKEPTREKRYKCSKCGKGLTFESYLKRHQASHLLRKIDEDDLKLECTVCGKKMTNRAEVLKHFQGICSE